MQTSTENGQSRTAMKTPQIVSAQEWEAAREQMLIKEKAMTRARDALAAERRRMPWQAVEKTYAFDGPAGRMSLLDLFDGRGQLIVYRAFFEPGVHGWPEHACIGCSLGADQVSNLAHLNARDTTLVYASRAPQADIARLKARMGWEHIPWVTVTDRGGVGGFAGGLPAEPTLQVVELERQLRPQRCARSGMGCGVGRRRGRLS